MNAKQSLLLKIRDGSFALLTDEQIATKLRLGRRESLAVRDMLRSLCREGELLCDASYRYGTAEQFGAKRGVYTGNERGFGFVSPDDGSPDWFIPRRAAKNALHGDTVLAFKTGGRSDDEGEVLAVLSRGYTELVGTYRREGRAGFLRPDEKRYSEEILIPNGRQRGCGDGKKAVTRILSYDGRTPVGEIVEILGDSGELFTEEEAIIRSHRLREEFPDEVLKEAIKVSSWDPLSAAAGRRDLRDRLIVTVDGEDTRDIDDAVSVERRGDRFLLGVHIADVSFYVRRGSALDKEAFLRGTSVYFPDRVLPMLPKELSNGICSLNEGVPRLTLSCFMTVDGKGNVLKREVVPSVICSRHRLTYREVTALARGERRAAETYPDLIGFVKDAVALTEILQQKREARGGVELDIKEAKILYSDGKITVPDAERTISEEMIEQFMVLANESVATLMTERTMPFVYRVHDKPSEEKARDFLRFLREAGISADFDPSNVSPKDYRDLLLSLKESPVRSVVNRVMLRSMMKAAYSPENIGHFGLASDCYCHFTSPIRRYPDLCVHRIIRESFSDPEGTRKKYEKVVAEAADRSSFCERNAADAERDVDALYLVAYMQDKIGEEYDATVSGVTSYGLYAELKNTVEGFIPIETLPDDGYEYSEDRFLLRGMKNSFRLGDGLRVRVVGVDWGARRVQFRFLDRTV